MRKKARKRDGEKERNRGKHDEAAKKIKWLNSASSLSTSEDIQGHQKRLLAQASTQ